MYDLLYDAEAMIEENPEQSIKLAQKAFDMARAKSDMYGMVTAKATFGFIGMSTNDYESSFINYSDALEYLDKCDTVDLFKRTIILNNLAIIRSSYDDHDGAVDLYREALKSAQEYVTNYREIAEEYGDLQLLIDLPYDMATELKNDGKYLEAGEILVDLWEQSEFRDDSVLLAKVVIELGLIKQENKEYAGAGEFFSIAAFNESVDPVLRSIAMHNLAEIYVAQEDYSKADRYYAEALELKQEHSSKRSQFITLLHQGELYSIRGDQVNAIAKWETAVNTFDGIKNDPDMFIVYDLLQKAYRSTDLNKSIEYSDLYAANFKNWMTVQSSQQDSAPTLQAFNSRIDTILADRALKAERLALLRQYWPLGVVALLLIMLFVYVVQLSFNKRRERVLVANLKADRATVADEILNRIRRD
ncbi:tetratricopeptide repeat protein [Roseivirga sp. E12]|uniref:tetratricopeptide repeat protein n=1 Tax=Roseivirga sp. E12 TaxID=2819237 RepID=UPI001ABCAABD|nr:tetratricopeptide repeat protein [Roseivirga sp. E12]